MSVTETGAGAGTWKLARYVTEYVPAGNDGAGHDGDLAVACAGFWVHCWYVVGTVMRTVVVPGSMTYVHPTPPDAPPVANWLLLSVIVEFSGQPLTRTAAPGLSTTNEAEIGVPAATVASSSSIDVVIGAVGVGAIKVKRADVDRALLPPVVTTLTGAVPRRCAGARTVHCAVVSHTAGTLTEPKRTWGRPFPLARPRP
ncbi:MAG TPA: hypothetical protein VNF07_13085 [Acidimicrobiales bacterium]|nr:hypothetical protein [Acidimicrobiales bacterium]